MFRTPHSSIFDADGLVATGGHDELLNLESRRPEVDEQSVFDLRSTQVAEQLGRVFVGDRLGRFEFDDQDRFNKEIREVFTEHGSVFVEHCQRKLDSDL